MTTKFCSSYHRKEAVKKCEECKTEWCPTCLKLNPREEYTCPNCGTTGYKIHLASE